MANIKLCLLRTPDKETYGGSCIKEKCKYWDKNLKNCIFRSGGFISGWQEHPSLQ